MPNSLQIFRCMCAAALLWRWMCYSFSQFRAARDQVVNSLIETATPSTFWVHVRLFEDVVLVPAGWQALILGLLLSLLLCPFLVDSGKMFSLVYSPYRSGLQQVTTGPRSLFSFLLQGQYFP